MRFYFLLMFLYECYGQLNDVVSTHSFSPPFTKDTFKTWRASSGVIVTPKQVMLTPHGDLAHGSFWNNVRSTMPEWEVAFRFVGTHVAEDYPIMGEGMAFWFIERPGQFGPVYGAADYWEGLGLFFAISPPEKGQSHGNLIVSSLFNDGSRQYTTMNYDDLNHNHGCVRPLQKWNNVSFAVRLRYQQGTLSVSMNEGAPNFMSPSAQCFKIEDASLGIDKYFGLTAHTAQKHEKYSVAWLTTRDLSTSHEDVALEQERQKYRDRKAQEQQRSGRGGALDEAKFQHMVLNLLHQLQDGQNVLDETQEHLFGMMKGMWKDRQNASSIDERRMAGHLNRLFDQSQTSTGLLKELLMTGGMNGNMNGGRGGGPGGSGLSSGSYLMGLMVVVLVMAAALCGFWRYRKEGIKIYKRV